MERGLSLIETLLALSIISSLAALALPSLAGWIPQHSVRREARAVQLLMERAYALALTRAAPVAVSISPGMIAATVGPSPPVFTYHLRSPVTARFKGNEKGPLVFYPSHTASPATILIEGPTYLCSVVLSLRGRTRRECP
jgi:prepilin-type N-terminal cleavage/methylation domain-containing protein